MIDAMEHEVKKLKRYSIYDYEKDTNSLISDSYCNINIYGKCVKCSKMLENYKESNAHISFLEIV